MQTINKKEDGFTYLEVVIAIVILTIGITAQLSAISLSVIRNKSTAERNVARQVASSTIESMFAARDLGSSTGISNWDAINTKDVDAVNGIFEDGWRPVRENPGLDGIHGTADDACTGTGGCTVGSYTNNSPIRRGIERKIEITDIVEGPNIRIKKRRVVIKVRYFIGQLQTEEELATIIADLPFYK
ncbi:MAG: hypothetical protein DWQ47_08190 [Acidobacteria bacterium]|nr:MAG: hypothetical protein DWQ32_16290 [Acidobacteriota bacterium]REJ99110.1 MAG: hypothetical protein DWQ38_13685 [Acidobacteriota bacterium]REK16169.1 MAG: hypothetical protein DWQ43_04000 [Acidobacteriota bacterium]REK43850.1 MAG: hypothetical protein DWQ47_08190 [Acidobacteriota bacterium]